MSFGVAVQSAIFYVVACTPCANVRHHKKTKAEAKRAREEKAQLEAEMPGLYSHPLPFNTNPYWSEEIMMGPHLPKKTNSKNTSERRLTSSGTETRSIANSSIALTHTNTDLASSPTMVNDELERTFTGEDWNKRRYQREDEELWGHEITRTGHKLMDAIKQAGSSAGRLIEASLGREPKEVTEEDRYNFYVKNPPVNDYHPPVVSRPAHKDAHKWMLQPPPPAKVMEGKVPVSRSSSQATHVSRRTVREGPPLGRLVHEKIMEAKMKNGEVASELELSTSLQRPTARRTNTASSRGSRRRTTRSRSMSLESSEASDEMKRTRRPRARPPVTVESDSDSDDENFWRGSSDTLTASHSTRAAQRPKLQTIFSSHGSNPSSRPKTPEAQTESQPNGDIDRVCAVEERKGPQAIAQPTA